MFEVFIYSLLIMAASLIGVFAIWHRVGQFVENNLRFLVSLSAGVFLVVSYQLSEEAIHLAVSPLVGVFWIAVGVVGIWSVFWLLPAFHHHHDEHEEEHAHSRVDARRIIIGDAIHNLGDGVLLAAAFMIDPAFGAITALSIFIHELIQETSEFFVLRQAGFSVSRALGINFLISSTILIGALGSLILVEQFSVLEVPLLGIAAGAFLVVVFIDLIPHSVRASQTKTQYGQHATWFVLGLILMFAVNQIAVHSHGEEGDLHHGHDHGEEGHHDEEEHDHEHEEEEHHDDEHEHAH